MPAPRIFVARQPILDRRGRTAGYELLYRASAAATHAEFSDQRTACLRTLVNAFVNTGLDALLGTHVGFLNVTGELLRSDLIEALPKDRVVLEILESETVDAGLERRCGELRRRGFALALDDYVPGDDREALLSAVDFVKVELAGMHENALRRLVALLRRHPPRLLAEKVETPDQYATCRALGFDLFQGFHFARPETVSASAVDPARAALLELLGLLRRGEELDRIEELFKHYVSLGLNLLRLVNSVAMARSQRISTVRQALVLLGRRRLERWLVLLLFAGTDPAGTASPLLDVAAMRGRLMELLASRGAGLPRGGEAECADRAFLVGMLSLVDALLGIPKSEVLDRLQVDHTIRLAVLERRQALGSLLALAEALERGDFAGVEMRRRELALDARDLFEAELEAAAWVGRLQRGGAAPDEV